MTAQGGAGPVPTVSIPDVRDYDRINAELVAALDKGHARVRLVGAEGQRLLAAGLTGAWHAVVEVDGRAGPELAAGMNAPGVTVVCRGPAADGAGRALRAGTLVVAGDGGAAIGYAMEGGAILVGGRVGPRAGLNQRGGVIVICGAAGRLAGERQCGGICFVRADRLEAHAGHGARGGRLVRLRPEGAGLVGADPHEAEVLAALLAANAAWVTPDWPVLL